MTRVVLLLTAYAAAAAGPVDFGQQELRAAMAERGVNINVTTELNLDAPETYHISAVTATSARISGGDLRGLMYALMDAAEQIRTTGKLTAKNGEPGMKIRGVRIAPSDADLTAPGFFGLDKWINFFRMLARNRINRAALVLPPTRLEPDRLRVLSQLAQDHGVDFLVGIRGPLGDRQLYNQIRRVLEDCVLVRGIQLEIGREGVEYFQSTVFPPLQLAGRRVILDLRGAEARPDILRAAKAAGIFLEVAGRSSTGVPNQPFHATVPAQSVAAELAPVAARLTSILASGANGFEVDLAGPNIEGYERVYWAWGRQGYDQRSPGLTTGKAQPRTRKK